MTIRKIQEGEELVIHTGPCGTPGSRQWIHVSDQASAVLFLLKSDFVNDVFHIAGERKSNQQVAYGILRHSNKVSWPAVSENAFDRFPGHDLHYALDDSKIRAAGWTPRLTFEQGLALTV